MKEQTFSKRDAQKFCLNHFDIYLRRCIKDTEIRLINNEIFKSEIKDS